MALAISEPTAEVASTANTNSYAMGAFTPAANALLVCMVFAGGTAAAGTMSGGGLTWTLGQSIVYNTTDKAYLFTAPTGTSPGSTTPTFECTGDNATGAVMVIFQVTGYNVQIQQSDAEARTAANPVITLASNMATGNAYMAGFGMPRNPPTSTAPGSWSEIADTGANVPALGASAAYRVGGETGTTITFTSASAAYGILAIEVYEANFSATGNAAFAPLAGSGNAEETFAGTGNAAFAPLAGDGTATHISEYTGSGGAAFAPLAGSGSAALTFSGTGDAAFAPLAGTGVGALSFVGVGDGAVAGLAASGTSVLSFATSSASAAMAPLAGTGVGALNGYLGSKALTVFFLASYSGAPWKGFSSLGTSDTRDLVTAASDPTVGTAVNSRTPAVWVSYIPPNHPLRLAPTTWYQRPYYNGQTGVWTALAGVNLTSNSTKPYDAGGAPKGAHGTTDFLKNASPIGTWLGTGTCHIFARVKTVTITSTATYYSAHAIIADSGQYTGVFVRQSGGTYGTGDATFEAGFLWYAAGAYNAMVDITGVVDNNGAGEFTLQAKRASNGDLFIRLNNGAWQAGTTATGALGGGGNLEVGGATYSAELSGEVLAVATWVGSNLNDNDSGYLATWDVPTTAYEFSVVPTAIFFPRRYDSLKINGGEWLSSGGVDAATMKVRGNQNSLKATAYPTAYAGSPDFEDGSNDYHYTSSDTGSVIGMGTEARSSWAWVRTESIVLTSAERKQNHIIWEDGGETIGLSFRRAGPGPYTYHADFFANDGSAKVASVEITSHVDADGKGEFSIATKNTSGGSGQMSISVNGGAWTNGNTVGDVTGATSNSPIVGCSPTSQAYALDGILFGLSIWKDLAMSDTDRDNLEVMAASLFDETEEASLLLKKKATVKSWKTLDHYGSYFYSSGYSINPAGDIEVAQSFATSAAGFVLTSVDAYLNKAGSATGVLVATIYASDGSWTSTSSRPTGAAIDSTNTLDVSTLSNTNYAGVRLTFAKPLRLNPSSNYFVSLNYYSGSGDVNVAQDGTSPTHGGFSIISDGAAWTLNTGTDLVFALNGWDDYKVIDAYQTGTASIDSIATSNQSSEISIGINDRVAGSFLGDGSTIGSVKFYLKKTNSPTGNLTAVVYAADFAWDSDGVRPTGTALATSGTLDATTLTTSYAEYTFTFATPFTTVPGTSYFISCDGNDVGGIGNTVQVATDSSPTGTHQVAVHNGTAWTQNITDELIFNLLRPDSAWQPEVGNAGAVESTLEPGITNGAPDFNGGTAGAGTRLVAASTYATVLGANDHCGYVVIDLDAVSARSGADRYNKCAWGYSDLSSYALLAIISDSGTPKAEFTTYASSTYARATGTLPQSTGKVFVAWRKWKGRVWISTDGASWVEGDTSSLTDIATVDLIIGKNPDYGLGDGSIDGRILELQFIKGAGRGVQWLKGAYERAKRTHDVQAPAAAADFVPTSIANCRAAYRASLGVTLSGSDVTGWADQSGAADSNRNFEDPGAGIRPSLTTSNANFNGRATIDFDGVDEYIRTPSAGFAGGTPYTQPITWYVVFRLNTLEYGEYVFDSNNGTDRNALLLVGLNPANTWHAFAGGGAGGGTPATSTTYVVCIVFNGASSAMYKSRWNTTEVAENMGSQGLHSITLGQRYALDGGFMDGSIAEIIAYSGAHSATTRETVMKALGAMYGVMVVA